ncbi:TPA: hypothetical protein ACI0PL_002179, partial [Streptococcus agalactiae]
KSPNYKKLLKTRYESNEGYDDYMLFFILNGNFCGWNKSRYLVYYILPELPEDNGDNYENS